jgi:nitrate/TMAO reductase-like tetraheme cytochrome c subunit
VKWRVILAAGGLAAVALTLPSAYVYDYVENDPRFCTSCHLMDEAYDRWAKSEHRQITCHSCHVSDLAGNMRRLYGVVFAPKTKVESHAEVDRTTCLKCHQAKGGERWQRILKTTGHAVHAAGKKPVQCIECHSDSVHVFSPPEKICAKCHEQVRVHEKMEGLECLSCHNFLAERGEDHELRPSASDCRTCHGEQHENEKAKLISLESVHGALDCRRCHSPHQSEDLRPGTRCTTCHKGEFRKIAERGPEKHRDCASCHEPHATRDAAGARCVSCHEDHERGAARLHSGRCETCHLPHTFRGDGRDCSACHADKATALFENAPKKHDRCDGCHAPHGDRAGARTCARCHAKQDKPTHVAKHRECTSCHQPHGKKPEPNAPCASCHDKQAAKDHESCRGCHATIHGEPETGAAACARCHTGELNRTRIAGTPERHMVCDSCHPVHTTDLEPTVDRCLSCHADVSAAGNPHVDDCVKCHAPHGPPKPSACRTCHAEARPDHKDCKGCHEPHRGKGQAEGRCRTCHEKEEASLEVWPAASDHTRCKSCHGGHSAKSPKACATCHKENAAKVAPTKHADCKACHPPHESAAIGASAWRASCGRCHGEQFQAVSSRGPNHSNCQSCHAPHDVRPPACDSCHAEIRAQLMHRVASHQEKCGDCHETHAPTKSVRATCVKCHEDKAKEHYPESTRCDACHPFGRR